jgi:hypothetical protein
MKWKSVWVYVREDDCTRQQWEVQQKATRKNEHKFWNYPLTYFCVYAARWFHANLFHIYFEIYKLWRSVVDCCLNWPDVFSENFVKDKSFAPAVNWNNWKEKWLSRIRKTLWKWKVKKKRLKKRFVISKKSQSTF